MGELEDLVRCTIKRGLAKMTLNISQLDIIKKMVQVFKEDVKPLLTFNTQLQHIRGLYLIKK